MDKQNLKCSVIIDEALPRGIIANAAAIMGLTLGRRIPQIIGRDVRDRDGCLHLGIVEFPIPVLRANAAKIKQVRRALYSPEFEDVVTVDFSDLAQSCKTYDEFISKMADASEADLNYLGIALCGNKKQINSLTGSMPLLR